MEDPANKVRVPGHFGPHPQEYHEKVYERLESSMHGKKSEARRAAFIRELDAIARDIRRPGSPLSPLLTKPRR